MLMQPNVVALDARLVTLFVVAILMMRKASVPGPESLNPLVKEIDDALTYAGYRTADAKFVKGKNDPVSVKIVDVSSPNHVLGRLWLEGGPKNAKKAKFKKVWFLRVVDSDIDVNELMPVVKQLRNVRRIHVEIRCPN